MKIEIVIKAFEDIIPLYKQAIKEKWDYAILYKNDLECGICLAIRKMNKDDCVVMFKYGYYKNLTKGNNYLFPTFIEGNKKSLHQRLKFLKTEIKDLKRLQKLGYTDI